LLSETNYINIYPTDLRQILIVGTDMAVDDGSKVVFLIPRGILPRQPIFLLAQVTQLGSGAIRQVAITYERRSSASRSLDAGCSSAYHIISYQKFIVRPLLREPRPWVHYKSQPNAKTPRKIKHQQSAWRPVGAGGLWRSRAGGLTLGFAWHPVSCMLL